MKFKIFALLLAMLLFLEGCSTPAPANSTDMPEGTAETVQETVYGECAVIDIVANSDGYYCLMSDVSVNLYDGEPIGIVIENPTLLSFQVSSAFDKGVYLFKLNEADAAIESLTSVMEELKAKGETELSDEIQEVLDLFNCSGPIIQAET